MSRIANRGKPGVVGVLLAAILGSGLFLVLIGVIVDGGNLYLDRQLQNRVAENTLASVAQYCGANPSFCETQNEILLVAQSALPDGSVIDELCGPLAGGSDGPVACRETLSSLDCNPPSDLYASNYMRLRVVAADADSRTGVLDALTFGSSPEAPTGCSQLAFFAPNGAKVPRVLPLALPACFVTDSTDEQVMVSIVPSEEGSQNTCTVQTDTGAITEQSISGFTLASLSDADRAAFCSADTQVPIPVGVPLSREPNEKTDLCGNAMTLASLTPLLNTTQYFPVVGPPSPTGVGNYDFEVRSFRAFRITGFKLKVGEGGGKTDWWWELNGCSGNSFCVSGYFESGTSDVLFPIDESQVGTIPDLDLAVIVGFY